MTTQEILLKAADLIERDGWCQYLFRFPLDENHTLRCVEGAIRDVTTSYEDARAGRETLRSYIADFSLTEWNDAPGRTKEEVLAALRGAAAQCEEG